MAAGSAKLRRSAPSRSPMSPFSLATDERQAVVQAVAIRADILDPRRLAGHALVGVADDERGLVAVDGEDAALIAPVRVAVIAGQVVEVLGRDGEVALEASLAEGFPRPGEPLAVLRFGKRNHHHRPP